MAAPVQAHKIFFFSLWALLTVLGGSYILLCIDTRWSVPWGQILITVVHMATLEFYLLFRLAQTFKSSRMCTRKLFHCRRRAAIVLPVNEQQASSSDQSIGGRCPFSRALESIEDKVHGTRVGHAVILIVSLFSILRVSGAAFILALVLSAGVPSGFLSFVTVIGLLGSLSFLAYLAFRVVIACGFIINPTRFSPRRAVEEEQWEEAEITDEKR